MYFLWVLIGSFGNLCLLRFGGIITFVLDLRRPTVGTLYRLWLRLFLVQDNITCRVSHASFHIHDVYGNIRPFLLERPGIRQATFVLSWLRSHQAWVQPASLVKKTQVLFVVLTLSRTGWGGGGFCLHGLWTFFYFITFLKSKLKTSNLVNFS